MESTHVQYNVTNTVLQRHSIRITNEIVTPDCYEKVFEVLENANEFDEVNITINSPGGDLMTFMQLYSYILNCRAHITTRMEGCVASAAAMLFLCGDSIIVGKGSCLMLHNYSQYDGGKGHEIVKKVDFFSKHFSGIFKEVMSKILTDKEIDLLIDGKDFWFDDKEVVKRMEERKKERERKEEGERKEEKIKENKRKKVEAKKKIKK